MIFRPNINCSEIAIFPETLLDELLLKEIYPACKSIAVLYCIRVKNDIFKTVWELIYGKNV